MSVTLPDTIRDKKKFLQSPPAGYDGCFDWSWTKDCFSGKITPMDWDGVIERKGNFLVFETKNMGADIPQGQRITLETAWKTGLFTIVYLWGKEYPQEAIFLYTNGIKSKVIKGKENIIERVDSWYKWADTHKSTNSEQAYDDIEYYQERAAILEFEAGYSREEAEKLAVKMMTERRLAINSMGK